MINKILTIDDQIFDYNVNQILTGELKSNDLILSELAAASYFGVARGTVRKSYARLEECGYVIRRIGDGTRVSKDAIKKLEQNYYYESDAKADKKVSFVVPDPGYYQELEVSLRQTFYKYKYDLITVEGKNFFEEFQNINKLIDSKIDGFIITPLRNVFDKSMRNYKLMIEHNVPFVMLGKPPEDFICDSVYCNDVIPSMKICETLIDRGCQKLIHVLIGDTDFVAIHERKKGYETIVKSHNMQSIIIDIKEDNALDQIKDKLSRKHKTGIFLHNDALALPIINCLQKASFVYGIDFLFGGFGFDSAIQEKCGYKFPSVKIPKYQMGKEIGRLLYEAIEYKKKSGGIFNHTIIEQELKNI